MFGFAAGSKVQIGIVAEHGRRLYRVTRVFARQFLKGVVGLLADEIALFDPSLETRCCTNVRKALFVIENFDPVSVFYRAHVVVGKRNLIA